MYKSKAGSLEYFVEDFLKNVFYTFLGKVLDEFLEKSSESILKKIFGILIEGIFLGGIPGENPGPTLQGRSVGKFQEQFLIRSMKEFSRGIIEEITG